MDARQEAARKVNAVPNLLIGVLYFQTLTDIFMTRQALEALNLVAMTE